MDWERVKKLFHEAVADPSVLDGVEPDLRAEVESLLQAHRQVPQEPVPEGPGQRIGPYKLLQEIGEGGFGVVYMAEQTQPVRRRVALKIIKLGMDTSQVVARFEAERQALALMDHPNIAKILDGGATEAGRPYFVMELVKGIPVTEYCDRGGLDTHERLRLFQQVCHAVQHAHQKGVIHRDLKPSNILVTLHDGVPVPKVIDFGIAKATDRQLTERTLFTEFRQIIGTPEYMAPEQAELSGLDVDTRADVYSLGVLLYELLTGTKPFDLKTLLQKGYDEVLRTIREVDPPKPSTRISTMGKEAEAVARKHHSTPALLGRVVRGDLDWIVMKALEKDRSRRYESANGLAMDVQRFLSDEPVRATPPSPAYRARKYLRRHRVLATVAAALLGVLVVSGGLAYAGMREANLQANAEERAAEDARRKAQAARAAQAAEAGQRKRADAGADAAGRAKARAETVLQIVQDLLGSADPFRVKGANYKVKQLLDDFDRDLGSRLEDEPEAEAAIRQVMGTAYLHLALYEKARRHYERELRIRREALGDDHADLAATLNNLATALMNLGHDTKAEKLLEEALAISRRSGGPVNPTILHNLAMIFKSRGKYDEAEKRVREVLAMERRSLGEEHGDVARSLQGLALLRSQMGDLREAETLLREALAIYRKVLGNEHPKVAGTLDHLADVCLHWANLDEAEKLRRESLAIRRVVFGNGSVQVAWAINNLATVLGTRGKSDEAERLFRQVLPTLRQHSAESNVAQTLDNLGVTLVKKGSYAEAEGPLREALQIRRRILREGHPLIAESLCHLGMAYVYTRRIDEAEPLLREALEIRREAFDQVHGAVGESLLFLGWVLRDKGALDEAEKVLREALAVHRETQGVRRPLALTLSHLAWTLERKAQLDEAIRLRREAVDLYREVRNAPDLAVNLLALARAEQRRNRCEQAEPHFREALGIHRRAGQPVDGVLAELALCLLKQGKHAAAEPFARECLAIRAKSRPGHWLHHNAMSLLGGTLAGQGEYADAEPLLVEGYEKMEPPEAAAFRKREALERVIELYESWGKPEMAEEWRAKR